MKNAKLATAGALLSVLMLGVALAEEVASSDLRQPLSVQRTAFQYDGNTYLAAEDGAGTSPSDKAAEDQGIKQPSGTDAVVNGKQDNGGEEEKADEPRRLFGEIGCTGINVNGWLNMGITGNADAPDSRYNGALTPNDRNEFQFNQVYMVFEKALKTDEHCWDFGGRVDLLYGSDYIYGISTGFETNPDGSPKWNASKQYGLIMPQVYGEVGHGKLSLKLGRFYTTIGYESLMAPNNFFYSMNYALRYAEPTSHTGGLLTYKRSDDLSFYVGGVNGQDQTDGLVDSLGPLLGFAYTPKDRKWALNSSIMTGCLQPTLDPTVFAPRTYCSTYLTYNFSEKFQSVTQYDVGWQENFDLAGHNTNFWSITEYLFYTLNEKWKAGLRYDMFRDEDGTRLGGLRFGGLPGGNPLPLPSGNNGTVQAISAGLNYTHNANLRFRPELRWDWYSGGGDPLFNDRAANRQFTAAVDMILLF